jgi:iron(III) transport system permease protein
MITPHYVFALALVIIFGKLGIFTKLLNLDIQIYGWKGVIIAQCLSFLPISFLMIDNAINAMNQNLEEAASDLGANQIITMLTVTFPVMAHAFLKAGLMIFVLSVSEFGNPMILGGKLPFLAPDAVISITGEGNFPMGSVLSIILLIPCIVIFLVQNYWLEGKSFTTITGKPGQREDIKLNWSIKAPILFVSITASIIILSSLSVIVLGGFVNLIGIDNGLTTSHFMNPQSNIALMNGLKVSIVTGLVGAFIGIIIAYVVMRGNFQGTKVIEFISLLGFAIPGTVSGIGYLLAFNSPPFLLTGTIYILILNGVFRFLAVAVEVGISKLMQIGREIEEASEDLGANLFQTFKFVTAPLMISAFVAGFLYTFMTSMISISSAMFLVSPGIDLACVYIFTSAQLGETGLACATSLKLILLVAVSLIILKRIFKKIGKDITMQKTTI